MFKKYTCYLYLSPFIYQETLYLLYHIGFCQMPIKKIRRLYKLLKEPGFNLATLPCVATFYFYFYFTLKHFFFNFFLPNSMR